MRMPLSSSFMKWGRSIPKSVSSRGRWKQPSGSIWDRWRWMMSCVGQRGLVTSVLKGGVLCAGFTDKDECFLFDEALFFSYGPEPC